MAQEFTRTTEILGGTDTEIYTCPAATTAILIGGSFCNIHTEGVEMTVKQLFDGESVTRHILKDFPVGIGESGTFYWNPDAGKLVLKPGDIIYGSCSNANKIEATLSILEIT